MDVQGQGIHYDPIIGYDPVKEEASVGNFGFGGPAYDGADQSSAELGMWAPPMQSADMDILPEKGTADARVRDVHRNDAYVANSTTIIQDSIVGEKFLLNSKPNSKVLGLDETWAEEFQEEVEAKFTLYAESGRNFPDASRHQTLTELIRLGVGVYAQTGEFLASAEWMRNTVRPFSTAMQIIDVDRLSNPFNGMDTPLLRGGVAKDRWGAAVGYWIRKSHPAEFMTPDNWDWQFVPATRGQVVGKPLWDRSQMLHIIDHVRPDQTRGIARIVSALKETKMGKKFRDTVLQSAVLNAAYAASIESDLPTEVAMAAAGGGDASQATRAIQGFSSAYLGEVAKYVGAARNVHFGGVKIPVFYPGTKMKLQNAATPGGVGSDFEKSLLRYLAAATGITYEQLSKDYAQANYSNLRAAIADMGRSMRVQKRKVADRIGNWFFRLWLEEALNKREITSMPRKAPNWYEGLNSDAYCHAEWIGASMGQIDELKETQAAVLRINNGLATREDELARLGKDWRNVYPQLAREKKLAEKYDLQFGADKDSQNMMNAASGTPSSTGDSPRSADKEEEGDE